MKKKSEVATIFPQFKLLVEKFFQTPIVSIFTDNGGEYIGLSPFLKTHGISHYTTPPHTPEQNGVAERRHRHIVETGLALLHYAKLPLTFWSYAFETAVYLINRLPTPILHNQIPYQHLFGQSPNYNKLKPFGCLCYPWLRPYTGSKLQPRSTPCLFLGYSTSKSAYKCYDPFTHRLYHSRHVQFIENQFPSLSTTHDPLPTPDTFLTSAQSHPTSSYAIIPHGPDIHPTPPVIANTNPSSTTTTENTTTTLISDPSPTPQPSTSHCPSTPYQFVYSRRTNNTSFLPSLAAGQPSSPTSLPSQTSDSSTLVTSPDTAPATPSTNSATPPSPPPTMRPRRKNPKYFNPSFVNAATLHPIPTTIEPHNSKTLTGVMPWIRNLMSSCKMELGN